MIEKLKEALNKTFYENKGKDIIFKTLLCLGLMFSPIFFLFYGIRIFFSKNRK